MATEESSQGAALGPKFSETAAEGSPEKPEIPDLHDVLGEFMEALCIIDVVQRVLMDLSADASDEVGPCALALKHGFEMLDAVYNRFDEGLIGYSGPGGDHEPEVLDDDDDPGDDNDEPNAGQNQEEDRDSARGKTLGKQNRLALVA